MRVVNISAVLHPTPAAKQLARKLGHRETRLLTAKGFLDGVVARDVLARILARGIELHQSTTGALDLRGLARHILLAIKRPAIAKMVNALAEVIDRGIDEVSRKTGTLDTPELAAYLLRFFDA